MTAEKSVDREEAIQFIRLIKQLNEAQQAGLRLRKADLAQKAPEHEVQKGGEANETLLFDSLYFADNISNHGAKMENFYPGVSMVLQG